MRFFKSIGSDTMTSLEIKQAKQILRLKAELKSLRSAAHKAAKVLEALANDADDDTNERPPRSTDKQA